MLTQQSTLPATLALLALTLALPPVPRAHAQQYISGGRALDHNLRRGSGGINPNAPRPPINQSSRIFTGNIGGGAAFQGSSPIRDTSQLFLNLPSAGLDNFRRDSLSVGDIRAGRTNLVNDPYYSRTATVVNIGGITAGLNQPGTSMPRSTNILPRLTPNFLSPIESPDAVPLPDFEPLDLRVDTQIKQAPIETLADPTDRSSLNPSLLGSSIFGHRQFIRPAARQDASLADNAPPNEEATHQTISPLRLDDDPRDDSLLGSPLEQLIAPSSSELSTRLETQFDNYVPPIPLDQNYTTVAPIPETGAASGALPERTFTPTPESAEQAPSPPPSGLNVFTDMQVATLKQMQSPKLGPDLAKLLGQPNLAEPTLPLPQVAPGDVEPADPIETTETLVGAPIRSFVGQGESPLNRYLARAEAALRDGRYYSAAATYSAAQALDPGNPLPLLGRAHALLAAGEYVNAAHQLIKAVTIFPDIAQFKLKLDELVQRPADLERRRADLEQRLERNENHNLRFVLGYIEYFTGLPQFGRPNMVKAAESFPPNAGLQKFISMLPAGEDSEPPTPTPTP